MKIRKFIVITLLSLLLLASLVTVWWFLNGENWTKGKIESSVSDITGRSFSIDGAFSLDLSASTVLRAENIRLSNPPWAINPDLARLDKLEISVDLLSVFSDPVRINHIDINGLVVALEENVSGEKSWEFPSEHEQAAPTTDSPPTELPVSVGSVSLVDFTLLHEAPDRTVPLDFHLAQLEMTRRADQQIQIDTDGRLGGEQFDIGGNLGPLNELIKGGKTSHDVRLSIGEIILQSQGNIEQSNTLNGANIKLTFSGPEFGWILTQLALPPFSHGDFDFKLDLQTEGNQTHLVLDGDLGSLEANARGGFNEKKDIDIQFAITSPSLKSIGELIDYPLPDDPFSLKARFKGSPLKFHAGQLEIGLGSSDLSGEVNVDLTGKPTINGVLLSNYLDLTWLQSEDTEDSDDKKPGEKDRKDLLIPDTPIEYPWAGLGDIDIDITINKLDFPQLTANDMHTRSRVVDGNLFVDTFQIRGEGGGVLSGDMTVEREVGSGITHAGLSIEGQDVKLGLGVAQGQDPETMRRSDLVMKLSGSGVTYHDLASSLNGHIELIQGAGLTENAGLSLFFGNFIGETLTMLNPFAETEKFTKNECAVGIVNIESGVVVLDPFVSQTDKMTLVAKGEVDLDTEKLQFEFNTKLRKGTGISASMVINPFVGITGTLASPTIGLDPAAVAVKGTVAVATLGISLLTRSLSDRFFSSKDPCGDALKKSREQSETRDKKGIKKK